MRIEKQKQTFAVDNLDESVGCGLSVNQERHGPLLPSTIRGLIIGPSNCGKTNVMISLITHPHGLRFANIYLYSKSLYQPKYEYLRNILKPIQGLEFYTFNNNAEIVEPSDAKPDSVFIFDDVICEKQDVIRSYFSMGRHKSVDCFYLAQTYSRIPKQLIRDNSNWIVMFKQDEMNMHHIFQDHVSPDVTFKEFQKMCAECWKDNYGFLVIDKDRKLEEGRYRKGLDSYIYP
jgi:Poxvirus A32 protein.